MKVLVTGASGFIGSYLYNTAKSHFSLMRAVRTYSGKDNEVAVGCIDELTDWTDALSGVDCVIHLAGLAHSTQNSASDFKIVNTDATINLAVQAASSGVKRFVFVSSIGVNGSRTSNRPFSPFDKPAPSNDYAKSKYHAELGLKELEKNTSMELVIIRPTLVYGSNAPGNFKSLVSIVRKLPLLPFGLSDSKRDFISIENLADFLLTCVRHPNAAGHIFLASDCETVSIKEFTNSIAKGLDKALIQLPVPISIIRFVARIVGKPAVAEQLLSDLQVDSSNAQEVLGWVPPYTMEQSMASLSEKKK